MARRPKVEDELVRAASAARALSRKKLSTAFSWESLDSRPTPGQLAILKAAKTVLLRIVRAGNQSGKGATAARDMSWFLNREHPYIDVTATWGTGPLLTIIAGQDRTQLETNLWSLYLKPLLADPTEWKESRPSGNLTTATNRRTGDQIIFISHNNASPDDIKHMSSYAAHYVWLDEMPKNPSVLEELTRRIDAKRGRLIATFTQKVRNDRIRKAVDALDPTISKLFRLNKLDNPLYADRKQEELAKISHLSADLQAAILSGDWINSSTRVYEADREKAGGVPLGYNPSWPHVVVVDPATESKLGRLVVAASNERTANGQRVWWVVQADYVENVYVPSLIVTTTEATLKGLHIIKRVYDTAASWFYRQAKHMGFDYRPIPDKSGKKDLWIAKTNEALGGWLRIADWCPKAWDELEECERSEVNPDKIANAHKYHLIDTIHYFIATKPPEPEESKGYASYWAWLHEQNNLRLDMERKKRDAARRAVAGRHASRHSRNRRWS